MMTINEMRVRRGEIWEQAKNFLDTHRNDYNEPTNQDKELKKISDHDIIIIKQKKNGGQIYGRANNIYSRVQEQNSD